MSRRAEDLAQRIEQGAQSLAALAENLTDQEWRTVVPKDGRPVGVVVHHVANMYPIEVDLAKKIAAGDGVRGVTWGAVAEINAKHASDHAAISRQDAIDLLKKNAKMAADAVRGFTDQDLDKSGPVSLNSDAPLTAQFFIEDHALRHSFHHMAKIREALGK
jgi:DinB superfamily